jgi:hypothetical protein
MSKIKFTLKERKIITVLMIVNCFALFVNYFGLSPKIKNEVGGYYKCLLTNSINTYYSYDYNSNNLEHYNYEFYKIKINFYPFVDFYGSSNNDFYFNGIFPYYDYTEFFVYTLAIFGFFVIRKLIANNEKIAASEEPIDVKKEKKFKSSKEYLQLQSLYNSGILTDEEFKSKVKFLKNKGE